MKYISNFGLFILIITQSCSKKSDEQVFKAGQTIQIVFNEEKFPPLDSFISDIKIVPLETNDNCLIGQQSQQVKVHQGLIYINSFLRQLFVFDLKGNFIREIGSRGQGPGEFYNVRDFIFTNEETIEILDFQKIECYTLEGKYVGTKRFDLNREDLKFNPMNFCKSFSAGYYFWEGMQSGRNVNFNETSHLMYRVDNNMQIESGFFRAKFGDGGYLDRFRYYQDKILIALSSLDYNIYQIDSNDNISIRYTFDFGKYGFKGKIGDDKTTIFERYISHLSYFHETDSFLYFIFYYQNKVIYNLLYSKATDQAFIKSYAPMANENEIRLFPVHAIYNDQLVSVIEPFVLKSELERMSTENIKKWGLENLHILDDEDNPVLILYTTKF